MREVGYEGLGGGTSSVAGQWTRKTQAQPDGVKSPLPPRGGGFGFVRGRVLPATNHLGGHRPKLGGVFVFCFDGAILPWTGRGCTTHPQPT